MSTEVLMGITVEEIQAKLSRMENQGEQAEGFNMLAELNGLKQALLHNPNIVNDLAEEDLGRMVTCYRMIHKDAFDAAVAKSTKKAKPKGTSAKAIKEAAGKTLDDLGLDLNDL